MNEQDNNVADEQMRNAFEEVGGRATPPNRLDEILKRAAADAGPKPGDHQAKQFKVGKLWAAALLLLGLGTTITASILKNRTDDAAAKQAVATAPVGEQDPKAVNEQERLWVRRGGAATAEWHDPSERQQPAATLELRNGEVHGAPGQDPKPSGTPAQGQGKPGGKAGTKGTKDLPKGDLPKGDLPKGTDPADIAVLRSAEAMLEAEKKLRALIKDGKIAGVDQVLPFDQLGGWKYTDGLKGMPEKVKALAGKKVLMLGFMLPIDEVKDIKQFLLVESLWSCCYGQPPDINGIVRCVMPKDKTIDYQFEPLKLVGKFKIEETEMDEYVVDIYQLHVDYVEVIEAAKPGAAKPRKQGAEPAKKATKKDVKKAAGRTNKSGR